MITKSHSLTIKINSVFVMIFYKKKFFKNSFLNLFDEIQFYIFLSYDQEV